MCKWLFNWEMGRGWKGLKVHTENMDIKGESVRSQKGMRIMLLETGGKIIPVIKLQRTWMKSVLVFCGR